MKKLNKKIENKLQELIIRAYSVTTNDINDEIWSLIFSKNLDKVKKIINMITLKENYINF